MEFEWIDGHWDYREIDGVDGLIMQDHNMESEEIEQLDVTEAKEMLGVFLAADGNNDVQVDKLREVAEEWNGKIYSRFLEKQDAWIALKTTVMKTIEYPLPALTLTEEESRRVMAPILEAGLRTSGICSRMARALVYGPKKFQGLGLKSLYVKQGIDKLLLCKIVITKNNL